MTDTGNTLKLPTVLDITGAPSLLESCRELQLVQGSLSLDASEVERFTTPALQILLALFKKRNNANLPTCIINPTSNFENAVKALGFDPFLKEAVTNG